MKKLRIGVMTLWNSSDNYGQIIQGYALQRYLEQQHCDAFIIRFSSLLSRVKELLLLIAAGRLPVYLSSRKKRRFKEFKSRIKYSGKFYHSYSRLRNRPPEADLLIAGSDQVWNYMRNTSRRNAYLLRFSDNVKKISYAASFGRDRLNGNEIEDFTNALSKFSAVTVREKSGADICSRLNIKSRLVADPVALIDAGEWREIESAAVFPANGKKNIFIYVLSENCNELTELMTALKEKYNVVYTNPNGNGLKSDRTPSIPEWIGLIDKSDVVITDSYHSTLLSIILKTQFVTISRKNGKRMNNRFLTLFDITGLGNRYVEMEETGKILALTDSFQEIAYSDDFIKLINDSKAFLAEILTQTSTEI